MSNQEKVFEAEWPEGLEAGVNYVISCDDACPTEENRKFKIMISPGDGDIHISMHDIDLKENRPDPFPSLRLRTYAGGGRHHRTRQALLWLAQAIKLDTDELSR